MLYTYIYRSSVLLYIYCVVVFFFITAIAIELTIIARIVVISKCSS